MSKSTLELYVPELHCSGCVRRLENALQMPADADVFFDPIKHRISIITAHEPPSTSLWIRLLSDAGFSAFPITFDQQQRRIEQKHYLKRLFVCSIGMMQAMMFTITIYLQTDMSWAWQRSFHWFSFLITTPVLLYAGYPFYHSATSALLRRQVNMDVPVALALWIAYVYSVWTLFTGGDLLYFDSISMFLLFLTLGRYAEWKTRFKAQKATEALWDLAPETTQRLTSTGKTETVNSAQLQRGDLVLVANGEHFPVDGEVVEGHAHVNESLLTGEANPIPKNTGDTVFAGSVNVGDPITCRTLHTQDDTKLGQIQRLLLQAQHNKPRIEQLTDRVASYFILCLLIFATLTGVIWSFIDSSRVIPIVVSVLIVTCPCALSLATPTALAATMARLARQGILISRSDALEKLTQVSHFFFDKTGTLTRGTFSITHCYPLSPRWTESECIRIASALEQRSTHPLAKAFQTQTTQAADTKDVKSIPGVGISGWIENTEYWLGAPDRLSHTLALDPCPNPSGENSNAVGESQLALATSTQWVALFTLADHIRPEAPEVLNQLKRHHTVTLLSGDNAGSVAAVAQRVGIDDYHARCLPESKTIAIKHVQNSVSRQTEGTSAITRPKVVAMVGDGANDGPVLAQADVGIAMGEGTALARASADVILLTPSLTHILTLLDAAQRTKSVIRQNLGWALIYNSCALPFAALGWVPAWLAAIGMSFSSLLVVLNSMKLLRTSQLSRTPSVQ